MKIAIMAAGAVGGYFGARLAQGGHEVTFVARGGHLQAIQDQGLRIKSELGDLHLEDVTATDDPAKVGPVDVILFAVKLWDTEASAQACRPMLGDNTAVLSLQNGIESADIISGALGADHALGGVAFISATISEPGVIQHFGGFASIVMGELDNRKSDRIQAFLQACEESGVEASIAENIQRSVWEKFIFLATLSGTTTASRHPIGTILADADMHSMFRRTMEEIEAVGKASGIDLTADTIDRQMAFGASRPPGMSASTLKDLEGGRPLETPWLTGTVVRLGRELGIATPVNDTLNALLKPYEMGAPD